MLTPLSRVRSRFPYLCALTYSCLGTTGLLYEYTARKEDLHVVSIEHHISTLHTLVQLVDQCIYAEQSASEPPYISRADDLLDNLTGLLDAFMCRIGPGREIDESLQVPLLDLATLCQSVCIIFENNPQHRSRMKDCTRALIELGQTALMPLRVSGRVDEYTKEWIQKTFTNCMYLLTHAE